MNIDVDNITSIDVDECTAIDHLGYPIHNCNNISDSHCEDLVGSFQCVCNEGYQTLGDGTQVCESKLNTFYDHLMVLQIES